jgi:hypothetical protein
VSRDGRFLLRTLVEAPRKPAMVLLNWPALLR